MVTLPVTDSGRELWESMTGGEPALDGAFQATARHLAQSIAAIEAEAEAEAMTTLRAKVEGLFGQWHPMCAVESEPTDRQVVSRKAVLALIPEGAETR